MSTNSYPVQFGIDLAKDSFPFYLLSKIQGNTPTPPPASAGEWNTLEVTVRGQELTLWVYGAVTCRFDSCGQKQGYVGVEGESYRVEFRNLKVKELP